MRSSVLFCFVFWLQTLSISYNLRAYTNILPNLQLLKTETYGQETLPGHFSCRCCCVLSLSLSRQMQGLAGGSVVKNQDSSAGDECSVSELRRSPGGGNGNPLLYSSLGSPMDREAWWAWGHGVAKSQTQLEHTYTHTHARTHTRMHHRCRWRSG